MATPSEAIRAFVTAQTGFNQRQGAAIDKSVAAAGGLSGDIAALNAKILELQNSPGQVTPEDQALIDELVTMGEAATARAEAQAAALEALDAQNPPTPPPV